MSYAQAATGKLMFRQRIDTVKGTIDALKSKSAFDAVENQLEGFGRNNRQLLRNFTGFPR